MKKYAHKREDYVIFSLHAPKELIEKIDKAKGDMRRSPFLVKVLKEHFDT